VEPIFEGEALISSPLDEATHDVKGHGIPWFKPFRIMQNKESIFGRSEFFVYVRFSHFPLLNILGGQRSTQLVADDIWSWLLTAAFTPNTRLITDDFPTPA
jgi:hypothetical protein